eukprot:m.39151 g.39151  ORF g.39151 m.39151 type:complete len:465 (+) comp32678_c0_seq3:70-1464(+)
MSFHVKFGFSETPLTLLLERRQYNAAEEIIASGQMSLDDGLYQRTPLFIVLSGEASQYDDKPCPRNLKLARKLLRRGADASNRVPKIVGAEFIHPGKSPLECLTESFLDLSQRKKEETVPQSEYISSSIIGQVAHVHVLLTDIIDLVLLVVESGAELNVRNELSMTPLHSAVLGSVQNSDLAETLCSLGADVNASDCQGNTPLMSLCSVYPWACSFQLGPSVLYPQCVATVASALLEQPDFKVGKRNKEDRTALFLAMQAGNADLAELLLANSADSSVGGRGPSLRYFHPLLAALIPWTNKSDGGQLPFKRPTNALDFVARLVDQGYFCTSTVIDAVLDPFFVPHGDPLQRLRALRGRLVSQLFGRASCSLSQLAARTVFRLAFGKAAPGVCSVDARTVHLKRLVSLLGLPVDVMTRFQVILLGERIADRLSEFDWADDDMADYGTVSGSDDEDDGDEDDDDSD